MGGVARVAQGALLSGPASVILRSAPEHLSEHGPAHAVRAPMAYGVHTSFVPSEKSVLSTSRDPAVMP